VNFSGIVTSTGFSRCDRRPSIGSRSQLDCCTKKIGGRAAIQLAFKNSNASKNALRKTIGRKRTALAAVWTAR
jgi:hypothetical protein